MKNPYGLSDFGQIRTEGYFYADKTPFLPVIEALYRHMVFLRPRRFGKSTLVSMLEHYYDLGRRDHFDALFGGLWVLYFLSQVERQHEYPDNMLDRNVRTEYGHIERIGTLSGAGLDARRSLLQTILGEGHIRSELVEQFGIKALAASHTPFLSLLYFLGMLTMGSSPRDAYGYDLEAPNRVIWELQWEHLALMLEEQAMVTIDVDELRAALATMAMQGEIAPFLELFHKQVIQAFSNRDTRGLDEKTIKLLLMTYASLGRAFSPLSEKEFAQGYGDLFLGASRNVAGARCSWLLELKYLKTPAKPAQIEEAFAAAEAQVRRCASDQTLLPMLLGDRTLKAGMLVFVGAKRVLFRPWDKDAAPAPTKKSGRR